jgi:hypothetical protein
MEKLARRMTVRPEVFFRTISLCAPGGASSWLNLDLPLCHVAGNKLNVMFVPHPCLVVVLSCIQCQRGLNLTRNFVQELKSLPSERERRQLSFDEPREQLNAPG